MKKRNLLFLISLLSILLISIGFTSIEKTRIQDEDMKQQSLGAFDDMMNVITHQRCMNCHPSDNFPRQGEDSHQHLFGIQRGEDGHGLSALQCNTCHQKENNDFSGVPGAPHWHLAPLSMGWQGLDRIEIAKAMMNPIKNGDRSLTDIVKHLTEDDLVLWAFEPGINHAGITREKPPLTKEEWIAAVKKWAETGAEIR